MADGVVEAFNSYLDKLAELNVIHSANIFEYTGNNSFANEMHIWGNHKSLNRLTAAVVTKQLLPVMEQKINDASDDDESEFED